MPKGTQQQGRERGVPPKPSNPSLISLPVPIPPCKLRQCLSLKRSLFYNPDSWTHIFGGKLSAKRKPVQEAKVKLCPVQRLVKECAPLPR